MVKMCIFGEYILPLYWKMSAEIVNKPYSIPVSVFQMKDEKEGGSNAAKSTAEPSPFVPPAKPHKRDRPCTFSPTEDTFKDTANLVKEDSDV